MKHLTNLKLKVWRQDGPDTVGKFETHVVESVSDEASFLEMLDQLNEKLIGEIKTRSFLTTTVAKESVELVR